MKKQWYHNETQEILIESSTVPDGYTPGRLCGTHTYWVNNGVIQKMIDCNSPVPEGFVKGMIKGRTLSDETRQSISDHHSKCKWYTNGIENKFCQQCPTGFHSGMTASEKQKHKTHKAEKIVDIFVRTHNKDEFEAYYRTHSDSDCSNYFNITSHKHISEIAKAWDIYRTSEDVLFIKNSRIEKTKNTCLKKYGTTSPMKSAQVKIQTAEKAMQKYGVPSFGQSVTALNNINYTDYFKKLLFDAQESENFMQLHNKEYTKIELQNMFNCDINALNNWIYHYSLQKYVKQELSHYEDEIFNMFSDYNPQQRCYSVLSNKQIDIYFPDYKFGIEFNGTYWHSTLNISDKHYHENKSLECRKKDIHLMHIYEYEWVDPKKQGLLISMINMKLGNIKQKIYARQCEVVEVGSNEAKLFFTNNHLQKNRGATIYLGLSYKGEIVQMMSFRNYVYDKNMDKNVQWEIVRECSLPDTIVVGGKSKLFSYFVRNYEPQIVFSYCDLNKFTGKSYEALGMQLIGVTGPDMKWWLKNGNVVNRNPAKHKEMKQLAKAQIFGAGSLKYIWKRSDIENV